MKTESTPATPPPAFNEATAIPVPTRREPQTARTVAYAQPVTEGPQAGMYALFGVQRSWIITVTAEFASEYFPAPAEPAAAPAS